LTSAVRSSKLLRKPAPFPSRSWEFYFQWSSQIRKKRPKNRVDDLPCLLSSWNFYWWMNSTPWSYSPHLSPWIFFRLELTQPCAPKWWWWCFHFMVHKLHLADFCYFCPECVNLLIWSPALDVVSVTRLCHYNVLSLPQK
jgi:hypothetical protein